MSHQILHSFVNADLGIEARVRVSDVTGSLRYIVELRDVDADQIVPGLTICEFEGRAVERALELVADVPASGSVEV